MFEMLKNKFAENFDTFEFVASMLAVCFYVAIGIAVAVAIYWLTGLVALVVVWAVCVSYLVWGEVEIANSMRKH